MIDEEFDSILAAVLRREVRHWPSDWHSPYAFDRAWDRIEFHGIAFLLIELAVDLSSWPKRIVDRLREEARMQSFWEASHHSALNPLVEALADHGVECLAMKGTALAYSLYDEPATRRRGDTDLLIHENDLDRARAIFEASEFRLEAATHGPFGDMRLQENWTLDTGMGFTHTVDLHWQASYFRTLRNMLDVTELFASSIELARLSPRARAPGKPYQLIQGCINQAMHSRIGYWIESSQIPEGDRLIWAWDYDLLTRTFSEGDWQEFVKLTLEKQLAPICLLGLNYARDKLSTSIPPDVLAELQAGPDQTPVSRFLLKSSEFDTFAAEIQAMRGFRGKIGYVLAQAFPSREHMHNKYPTLTKWPLILLYLRRQISAVERWIRKCAS